MEKRDESERQELRILIGIRRELPGTLQMELTMDGVRVGWYRFEWCQRVGGVLVGWKGFVGRL
jgi:hypothetical protein